MKIKSFDSLDHDGIIRVALRAWAPVFQTMEPAMNPDVYQVFYGDRWQATQQQAVDQVCADVDNPTWVAILSGEIVGFIAIKLHHEGRMGEIYMVAMVAVDPDFQGQGVGGALIQLL